MVGGASEEGDQSRSFFSSLWMLLLLGGLPWIYSGKFFLPLEERTLMRVHGAGLEGGVQFGEAPGGGAWESEGLWATADGFLSLRPRLMDDVKPKWSFLPGCSPESLSLHVPGGLLGDCCYPTASKANGRS